MAPVLNNCYQTFFLLHVVGYVFILYPQMFFMKWVMINNKRSVLQEYWLTKGNETKEVVKYNPIQRSTRISTGDYHRLFFIESTGSLTGKYIFKNEYGIEVGSMSNDKLGKEGTVIIEGKKFVYKVNNGELHIHDGSTDKLLVSCGLAATINGTSLSLSSQSNADTNYLLLGLCWFLFLPVAKENRIEYAA